MLRTLVSVLAMGIGVAIVTPPVVTEQPGKRWSGLQSTRQRLERAR
jgi:hypothetical protein